MTHHESTATGQHNQIFAAGYLTQALELLERAPVQIGASVFTLSSSDLEQLKKALRLSRELLESGREVDVANAVESLKARYAGLEAPAPVQWDSSGTIPVSPAAWQYARPCTDGVTCFDCGRPLAEHPVEFSRGGGDSSRRLVCLIPPAELLHDQPVRRELLESAGLLQRPTHTKTVVDGEPMHVSELEAAGYQLLEEPRGDDFRRPMGVIAPAKLPAPEIRCRATFETAYREILRCELEATDTENHRAGHTAGIDNHRYTWG